MKNFTMQKVKPLDEEPIEQEVMPVGDLVEDSPLWSLGPFVRPPAAGPVIQPDVTSAFFDPVKERTIHWENISTFNPAAVVRNGQVYLLYRAEEDSGSSEIGGHTSRIGLALSDTGLSFIRDKHPVLYPDGDQQFVNEKDGGCEDPRIVETVEGAYIMAYTQWNRTTYQIAIARSDDLRRWVKHGPAFGPSANGASFLSKSAGIVTTKMNGRMVAVKIAGSYWMYWGENPIRLAISDDLLHWKPVLNSDGTHLIVLEGRPGHFDSAFCEVGPPPVLTEHGIVLLYNGKNDGTNLPRGVAPNAYSAGQALFSSEDPTRLLARTKIPFLRPELEFEASGQYVGGTTFVEGLVWFAGRWMLYYGCADSRVGVVFSS